LALLLVNLGVVGCASAAAKRYAARKSGLPLVAHLGDAGIPSAGTVGFSVSPTALGSFTSSRVTFSPSGAAFTKFIASTNGGSGTITANATGLKDEGGKAECRMYSRI